MPLNLPESPEERPFLAIVELLSNDADLRAANVSVWTLAKGSEYSPGITPVPNVGDMPVIRVRCGSYPTGQWTEAFHRGKWQIVLELFTAGTDEVDQFRLMHAVRRVLKPATTRSASDAVRAAMDPTNSIVQHSEFRSGSTSIVAVGESGWALRGQASVELTIQVPAS